MKKIIDKIMDVWYDYPAGTAIIIYIISAILALGFVFGIVCLQAWLIMLLWNWVVVNLFGAPVLGFWVAFGLRCLCFLLFKGINIFTKKKVNKNKIGG